MKKFIILFSVLIGISSCDKQKDDVLVDIKITDEDRKYVNKNDFFEEYLLYKNSDTILLYTMIDKCGEWGGPKEEMKIFPIFTGEFQLNYRKHKFNCDSISFYYNNNSILDFEKKIILGKENKKELSDFFLKLMKAKINERVNSNAGSVFSLVNSDSTIVLYIHTGKTDIVDSYQSLIKKLNLK